MIVCEPSRDYELIRTIATHPKLYPHISDDFSPRPEDFRPVEHESVTYLIVRDDDQLLGFFGFHPHTATIQEVHTCLLPGAWGEKGKEAAAMAMQWVWRNLPCIRLITNVPTYNRLALKFAKSSGMTQFGLNPDSYVKDSRIYGMIMLGVSRPGTEAYRGEECP